MHSLAVWQNYISCANQYFLNKDYVAALDFYQAACSEAESLYDQQSISLDAVSVLVVSNLNLAEWYQQRGFTDKSRSIIEKIHLRMLHSLMKTCVNHKNHDALMRATMETYRVLIWCKDRNRNF